MWSCTAERTGMIYFVFKSDEMRTPQSILTAMQSTPEGLQVLDALNVTSIKKAKKTRTKG